MGDFVNTGTVNTAVRELAAPIADLNSFNTIISNVLTNNPWECTSYESGNQTHPAVERSKESYSGRVIYQNNEAKVIGNVSIKAPNTSAFTSAVARVLADADLRTAIGGVPAHDSSEDKFSCTLKCHNSDGEIYMVTFSRDRVVLSSYTADTIRTDLDTWADSIPALA